MKLSTFDLVQRTVAARRALVAQLSAGSYGVTIDGRYQDAEMVTAVTPVIQGVLVLRIAELDADLAAMGVRVTE